MDPQDTIDLGREAITMIAIIGGPILAAGLVIGLIVGIFQAMTQIQDQTVSAVPKILGMLAVTVLVLPWLSERMVDYTRQSLQTPMVGGWSRPVSVSPPPTFRLASATTGLKFHSQNQPTVPHARVAGEGVPLVAPPLKPATTPVYPAAMPTMSTGPSSMPVHRHLGWPIDRKSSMPQLRGENLNTLRADGQNREG